MENRPIVCVVDDDDGVCRALRRLLDSVGLTVKSFSSAGEFLGCLGSVRPSCLIVDVRMPGMSGLELQNAITERGVRLPIVFVTAHADVPMGVQAMKGGAVDFIEKPFSEQSLLDAVNRALARDAEIRRLEADHAAIIVRLERLTPREQEVFKLVVKGRLNKQIALELGASEKTIKIHRARVMQKMEAESLADLVIQASAIGLAGPIRAETPPPSYPASAT